MALVAVLRLRSSLPSGEEKVHYLFKCNVSKLYRLLNMREYLKEQGWGQPSVFWTKVIRAFGYSEQSVVGFHKMTETILKSNFGTAWLSDMPPGFYTIICTKLIFSASYVIFFQAISQPSFSLDERQQRVKVLSWYARIYICNRFSF